MLKIKWKNYDDILSCNREFFFFPLFPCNLTRVSEEGVLFTYCIFCEEGLTLLPKHCLVCAFCILLSSVEYALVDVLVKRKKKSFFYLDFFFYYSLTSCSQNSDIHMVKSASPRFLSSFLLSDVFIVMES